MIDLNIEKTAHASRVDVKRKGNDFDEKEALEKHFAERIDDKNEED